MINTKQQNIGSLLKQSVVSGLKPSYDKYREYQFDANSYVENVLGLTAWSSGSNKWDEVGQWEVLDYYSKTLKQIQKKVEIEESLAKGNSQYTANDIPQIKNWIRIEAGHSIGKCLGADECVILADGSIAKAKNLIGQVVELPDINGTNKAYFFDNGIRECVELFFDNGVKIIRTLNHPLWVNDSWVNAGDLTIGTTLSLHKYKTNDDIFGLEQWDNSWRTLDDILPYWYWLWSHGHNYKIVKSHNEIFNIDEYSLVPDESDSVTIVDIKYLTMPTVGVTVPTTNTFTTFIYEHNTNLASMIVNHFFDCFVPSIGLCYAPTYPQVNDLLFKEIRKWRTKNNLHGTILKKPELYPPQEYKSGDWFVKGKAVGNDTESIQGQHDGYMLFILDEAEGLPQYLYDAVLSMASGSWSIVILLANPRTTISPFYEIRQHKYVQNFRISCLNHPNVKLGYEKIRGATTRAQVLGWLYSTKCKTAEQHDPNKYTFQLDWHTPDVIYTPSSDFLFRVMGIAPPHLSYDSFFSLAQVEKFVIQESDIPQYEPPKDEKQILQIGVDVARHGGDYATIYTRFGNIVRCEARMLHSELSDFIQAVREILSRYTKEQIEHVSIRVDATGQGWFLVDYLNMADFEFDVFVHPIQNNETAVDIDQYADVVTEMYALAGDEYDIKVVDFEYANTLQFDCVNRTFSWMSRGNKEVKRLNKKDFFKKNHKHSPDDSDGFVLAIVPDDYFGGHADFGFV